MGILGQLILDSIQDKRARKMSEGAQLEIQPGNAQSILSPDMLSGTLKEDWSTISAKPKNPNSKYAYLAQEKADALQSGKGLALHQDAIKKQIGGLERLDQETLHDPKSGMIYKWQPPMTDPKNPMTVIPGYWGTYAIGPDGRMARKDGAAPPQLPPPGAEDPNAAQPDVAAKPSIFGKVVEDSLNPKGEGVVPKTVRAFKKPASEIGNVAKSVGGYLGQIPGFLGNAMYDAAMGTPETGAAFQQSQKSLAKPLQQGADNIALRRFAEMLGRALSGKQQVAPSTFDDLNQGMRY